ncbi:putative PAAR repeat-containing protein (modular protein) [Vibrio nigripulchritudo SFn118]|nr:PAAR domain-containing protein [Vibrio nigripulchritudo]CCN71521.1 putative PAAR repeat-containing protein (modular protein) [Vibrio nigripulchritudo SFn118]
MGKPAATVTSAHVCPKVTGKIPHVGGPVVSGSGNVLIGGLPAARKGDTLVCIGPPDTVKQGSGSVFINGKPAARMGDGTDHGGKIVVGNPTVLIGDRYRAPKQPPPKTFEQAKARLKEAKKYVEAAREGGAALPGTPYTTADKREIVAKGLDEPLLVRVMLSDYDKDEGYLGQVDKATNTAKYWTTTFTQAEHGDTDPQALCEVVGIDYDPNANYSVILIDHQKADELGDMHSFIPTYERMADHTVREVGTEFEESSDLVEPCMTPEFSQYYEKVHESAAQDGISLDNVRQFNDFCHELEFTPSQIDNLDVRYKMHQGLGANEHFLGNGLTKDITVGYDQTPFGDINDDIEYGVCETFTWDKNPQTLGKLEKAGEIIRVPLKSSMEV